MCLQASLIQVISQLRIPFQTDDSKLCRVDNWSSLGHSTSRQPDTQKHHFSPQPFIPCPQALMLTSYKVFKNSTTLKFQGLQWGHGWGGGSVVERLWPECKINKEKKKERKKFKVSLKVQSPDWILAIFFLSCILIIPNGALKQSCQSKPKL